MNDADNTLRWIRSNYIVFNEDVEQLCIFLKPNNVMEKFVVELDFQIHHILSILIFL